MDPLALFVAIGGIFTGLAGAGSAIYQVRTRTKSHDLWAYVHELKTDREEMRAENRELRARVENLETTVRQLRREYGQAG